VLAAVIAIGAWKLTPKALWQRLTEGTGASTFEGRVDAWQRGIHEWHKVPLTGVGPGTYAVVGLAPGERERVAHNTFVSVLVETGIVGFALYFAFWALALRRIFRMPKEDRFFWLVFLVSLLPCMVTASAESSKLWWLVGALILCQSANPKPARTPNRRSPVVPMRMLRPGFRPPGTSRA
jgi:O-antigen ligase